MGFYVYTLKNDVGLAPNPFFEVCTLACCKPKIRGSAREGDWIIGITPKDLGQRLAYAMKVEEVLTFADYWQDQRFLPKRPRYGAGLHLVEQFGDNFYEPLANGFRQHPSCHYDFASGREDEAAKAKDLGGEYVLASRHFAYYGNEAIPLPAGFDFMLPARYSRVNFSAEEEAAIGSFVRALPLGLHGLPRDWRQSALEASRTQRCE